MLISFEAWHHDDGLVSKKNALSQNLYLTFWPKRDDSRNLAAVDLVPLTPVHQEPVGDGADEEEEIPE